MDRQDVKQRFILKLAKALKDVQAYAEILGAAGVVNTRSYDPTRYVISPTARSEKILQQLSQLYQEDELYNSDTQISRLADFVAKKKLQPNCFFAPSVKNRKKQRTLGLTPPSKWQTASILDVVSKRARTN